jgi:addiction module HigA family antidote
MSRMKNPAHPGEILREYLATLSVTEAAKRLGITRVSLSRILNGKSGISAEMAIRLETFLGTSAEMWMSAQMAFDLWKARSEELCEDEGCPHHGIDHVCVVRVAQPSGNSGEVAQGEAANSIRRILSGAERMGYMVDTSVSLDLLRDVLATLKNTAERAAVPEGWRDELDLIRAVLEGYQPSIARNDALRAVRKLLSAAPTLAGEDGT